jgi:hypothetical protein
MKSVCMLIFAITVISSEFAFARTPQQICERRYSERSFRDLPAAQRTSLITACVASEQALASAEAAASRTEAARSNARLADCLKRERGSILWIIPRSQTDEQRVAAEDRCRAQLDPARAAVATAETDERAARDAVSVAGRSVDAVLADNERLRDLHNQVRSNIMDMRMSVVEIMALNDRSSAKLESIATAIDNSALGVYMRDRMAAVLSSAATCKAVSTCASGTPTAIKGSELNSAFNSKMGTTAAEVVPAAPAPAPAPAGVSSSQ